ncbi:rhomboid family intramembrane serine protease [Marinicrinis sediminis]|uniref:Rhomboid family intramembrane serine protease n=1 Tax=Marinicrinis sediminis TaxID=1652465 RepID=A0ABW5R7T3_9BACL
MLFLRYESFGEYVKRYPITSLLLLANVLMFVLVMIDGGVGNGFTLVEYGALYDFLMENGRGDWWRYFAAMFLHFSFSHLLFNCFALFVFAPPLENILGKWAYLIFYLGSGLVGNLISELVHVMEGNDVEPYISAGASGAVYGVYGAFLFMTLFYRHLLDEASRKMVQTILIIGIIYSFVSPYIGGAHIGVFAHLGGLLGGFLIFGAFFRRERLQR